MNLDRGGSSERRFVIMTQTYHTHLVLFCFARDGDQLRIMVEPKGSDRGCEVVNRLQEFWFI